MYHNRLRFGIVEILMIILINLETHFKVYFLKKTLKLYENKIMII